MSNLKKYAEWLSVEGQKGSSRQDTPKELGVKTLWIPEYSGNRTATIDLNHVVEGFDIEGNLWGKNGNCNTPYIILEVPTSFVESDIDILANKLAKQLGKTYDEGNERRVLKTERIEKIKKLIS